MAAVDVAGAEESGAAEPGPGAFGLREDGRVVRAPGVRGPGARISVRPAP
jgi:hypothetical protein